MRRVHFAVSALKDSSEETVYVWRIYHPVSAQTGSMWGLGLSESNFNAVKASVPKLASLLPCLSACKNLANTTNTPVDTDKSLPTD